MLYDNPAERLRDILARGRTLKNDLPCRRAWAEIFKIDPNSSDEMFSMLGKVMALPRETTLLLKTNFPRQLAAAQQWRERVDVAFSNQNLSGQWVSFIGHIDDTTINLLSMTAELLESRLGAKLLSSEALDEIQQNLRDLIKDVDDSDLPLTLKSYLAVELSALLQHTREYRISGAQPILKQAESMIGHAVVDPAYKTFLTDHDLGKRLLENLNAAAAVLTVALQLPQLGQTLAAALR